RRPRVGGSALEDPYVFRWREPLRVRERARDRAVPVRGSSPPVPLAHRAAVHRCRGRFNDHTGARGNHGRVHRLPRGGTRGCDPRRDWALPARVSHHRALGSPFPPSGQEPTGQSVRRWRHGRGDRGHRWGRGDPRAASSAPIPATLSRAPVWLEGRLDEPFWAAADSINAFRQREPLEGSPATERTVVKVAHDADALYIVVRCYDSNMRSVRASQLRRDADLSSDDNVQLLIDSFDDRRSAFVFATNPNGALWDAQFSGVDDLNENW